MIPSPYVIARRILGRRGAFALRRIASSIALALGVYERPGRPEGVSAMVCSFNEPEWIEVSLKSAADLVDEYVVVDSSDDETPRILEALRGEGLNVRVVRAEPGSLSAARNLALRHSSFKWILHLDPDMILYPWAAKEVRGLMEGLDPGVHYLVYWAYLPLCVDLAHLCRDPPVHVEHWLFTWSTRLVYRDLRVSRERRLDILIAPLRLYRPVMIEKTLGVHLSLLRRPEKLAVKYMWKKHRIRFEDMVRRGVPARDAALALAREEYGVETLEEAGYAVMEDLRRRLPEYKPEIHGPLPRGLLEYVKRRAGEDPYYEWLLKTYRGPW